MTEHDRLETQWNKREEGYASELPTQCPKCGATAKWVLMSVKESTAHYSPYMKQGLAVGVPLCTHLPMFKCGHCSYVLDRANINSQRT